MPGTGEPMPSIVGLTPVTVVLMLIPEALVPVIVGVMPVTGKPMVIIVVLVPGSFTPMCIPRPLMHVLVARMTATVEHGAHADTG